uniref:Uncharacterized protein n=1 Tax=Eufriesea mexicana TaxID=516756 RepID=A0A310SSV0_9HYME
MENAFRAAVGELGVVRQVTTRVQLEIVDLDTCTTREEVEGAFELDSAGMDKVTTGVSVRLLGSYSRERRKALMNMN